MSTTEPIPDFCTRVGNSKELRWRLILLVVFILGALLMRSDSVATACGGSQGEWQQLYWYSAVLILTAQMSDTVKEFFMGEGYGVADHLRYFILGHPYAEPAQQLSRDKVGFWTLMPSGENSAPEARVLRPKSSRPHRRIKLCFVTPTLAID